MANNYYGYQYDTNPRKIDTSYNKPKKKKTNNVKKQNTQVSKKANHQKTNQQEAKNQKQELKAQKIANLKIKFSVGFKTVLMFAILFLVLFREAQINELFTKIQEMKVAVTTTQKENDQLEISIQNSENANNIEQSAKERLGMQKLTAKQTVYISLPKEDYVEHRTEEVIIEEEKSFIETFLDNIKNLISKK